MWVLVRVCSGSPGALTAGCGLWVLIVFLKFLFYFYILYYNPTYSMTILVFLFSIMCIQDLNRLTSSFSTSIYKNKFKVQPLTLASGRQQKIKQ